MITLKNILADAGVSAAAVDAGMRGIRHRDGAGRVGPARIVLGNWSCEVTSARAAISAAKTGLRCGYGSELEAHNNLRDLFRTAADAA